jgi:hypothetical protein
VSPSLVSDYFMFFCLLVIEVLHNFTSTLTVKKIDGVFTTCDVLNIENISGLIRIVLGCLLTLVKLLSVVCFKPFHLYIQISFSQTLSTVSLQLLCCMNFVDDDDEYTSFHDLHTESSSVV